MNEARDRRHPRESKDQTLPHIRILQQPIIRFFSRQETFYKTDCSYNARAPKIQVVGWSGPVLLVISCVTKDPPFRPHPYNLVGTWCRSGVCYLETFNQQVISLNNLAVATVAREEVELSLNLRESLQVDPFRTGFGHKRRQDELDLTSIRLAIQGFLQTSQPGYVIPLDRVLSEPIYSQKIRNEDIISSKDALITTDGEATSTHEVSTDSPLPKELPSIKIEPEEEISTPIQPYIQIVVQPQSKSNRFRYECERPYGGSVQGVGHTSANKNWVKVKVVGYDGPALMMVCPVTKESPYRQHPHKLSGPGSGKEGVCYKEVKNASEVITFKNLGICCIKKKHLLESLALRESSGVDPFKAGFSHKENCLFMDLSVLRLGFQAFLPDPATGQFTVALPPIVSDPIFDKKSLSELFIAKLSHNSSSVSGDDELILLCEKVSKEDIKVRFYELKNNELIWEDFGTIELIHKQTAIFFKTPKYRLTNIDRSVQVLVQLCKPSDSSSSDSVPFHFTPSQSHLNLDKKKGISELNFIENLKKLCPSLPFVNNRRSYLSFPNLNITPEVQRMSFLGEKHLRQIFPVEEYPTSLVDCDPETKSVLPYKSRKRLNMNCIDYVYLDSSGRKNEGYDSDQMFVMSILPFLHQLSPVDSLHFREEVIRILKTMLYPRAVLLSPFNLTAPSNTGPR